MTSELLDGYDMPIKMAKGQSYCICFRNKHAFTLTSSYYRQNNCLDKKQTRTIWQDALS